MEDVIADQIEPAVDLNPDLVTICAGMNDLMRMRTDVDTMMTRYAAALKRLKTTGALVVTFTAADIGSIPLFRRLRGRAAIYNELIRGIADDLDLQLVDFWRFAEYRDPLLWDRDRVHLSPSGHVRMAGRVLDTLAVPHLLPTTSDELRTAPPALTGFGADLRWLTRFAAPWIVRRMRRVTPGAGVEPKLRTLTAGF